MTGATPALLSATQLRALPSPGATPADCGCVHLRCAGWESIAQPLAAPHFRRLGTLRASGDEEPGLDELPGSRLWASETPISVQHHPCNRSEVWACAACGVGFLQYTEFGGYYVDHRVRQIDPERVI